MSQSINHFFQRIQPSAKQIRITETECPDIQPDYSESYDQYDDTSSCDSESFEIQTEIYTNDILCSSSGSNDVQHGIKYSVSIVEKHVLRNISHLAQSLMMLSYSLAIIIGSMLKPNFVLTKKSYSQRSHQVVYCCRKILCISTT